MVTFPLPLPQSLRGFFPGSPLWEPAEVLGDRTHERGVSFKRLSSKGFFTFKLAHGQPPATGHNSPLYSLIPAASVPIKLAWAMTTGSHTHPGFRVVVCCLPWILRGSESHWFWFCSAFTCVLDVNDDFQALRRLELNCLFLIFHSWNSTTSADSLLHSSCSSEGTWTPRTSVYEGKMQGPSQEPSAALVHAAYRSMFHIMIFVIIHPTLTLFHFCVWLFLVQF